MHSNISQISPINIDTSDAKFLKRLEKLELGPILFKLVKDPDSGIPWPEHEARATEIEYRKYLFLQWKYKNDPKIVIVPNKLVDKFWHQHILDTAKYQQDCELLFAKPWQIMVSKFMRQAFRPLGIQVYAGYLQHFPYLGLRSKEDAEFLQQSFEVVKQLWFMHFPTS